jgi:hypothetical protein
MGFRYHKRIKIGKGLGVNLSKSGVSPSYRTKYGSISPKGFSIRTGIPGLTYKGGKNSDAAGIVLAIAVVTVGALIIWNVLLFIGWLARETYHFILRKKMEMFQKESLND